MKWDSMLGPLTRPARKEYVPATDEPLVAELYCHCNKRVGEVSRSPDGLTVQVESCAGQSILHARASFSPRLPEVYYVLTSQLGHGVDQDRTPHVIFCRRMHRLQVSAHFLSSRTRDRRTARPLRLTLPAAPTDV